MVLSGLGVAAAGICENVASGHGAFGWEADDVFAHYLVGCRENKAHQSFERQYRAIDFKIQRQALHREDIRDLVELTTSRMDIYHLVGTLLLTFCIEWYADNEMLKKESDMPVWYADLFLISNLSAVGYLILSVWLAMYAAIASRSIGTRLLTSFARLSFPSRSVLQQIKVPIFFSIEEFFKRRVLGRPDTTKGNNVGEALGSAGDGLASEDDQQHFRRFLQELPRWLSYDTYSRVCMSYGMNQMLQALSYYVMGVIWITSPLAAAFSFLMVKFLALAVLWLDIGDHMFTKRDMLALTVFYVVPHGLAGALLYLTIVPQLLDPEQKADSSEGLIYKGNLSGIATLCFWGNAGWLWYMARLVSKVGTNQGRFKPGKFANVLEWVQNKAARQDIIDKVRAACDELRCGMADTVDAEYVAGCVSLRKRRSDKLVQPCANLIEAHQILSQEHAHSSVQAARCRAEEMLRRFEAWATAPKILAAFDGLLHEQVQDRLSKKEKQSTADSYNTFLQLCQDHDFGMTTRPSCSGDQEEHAVAMPISQEDKCIIRIDVGKKGPVWIDTRGDEVSTTQSGAAHRITTFHDTVNIAMPSWKSQMESFRPDFFMGQDRPAVADAQKVNGAEPAQKHGDEFVEPPPTIQQVDGGPGPGVWTEAKEQEVTAPPDHVPVRLVKYFTAAIIVWWLLAGLVHAGFVLTQKEFFLHKLHNHLRLRETYRPHASVLDVHWPEPATLFKVASLNCNGHQVWVSSNFSLFAAAWKPALIESNETSAHGSTLGALREVGDGVAGTVLCGSPGCHVLSPPADDRGPWRLTPVGGLADASTPVHLPQTWRLVTGAWADCPSTAAHACDAAWFAGWDGASVFAAALRRATDGAWNVHTRFALDPKIALCPDASSCLSPGPKAYADVKALQVSADGRALLVLLSGGVVDAWDLAKGVVHGRLHLGGEYGAMCHNGRNLLVTNTSNAGPQLTAVQLPSFMEELLVAKPHQAIGNSSAGEPRVPNRTMESATLTRAKKAERAEILKARRAALANELSEVQQRLSHVGPALAR